MLTPNETRLAKLLALHEGRVAHAYQDSLGYWTIGVGHLIDRRKGGKLPEHIVDALFEYDLRKHEDGLVVHSPWITQLDVVRRAVLTDMAFNMGTAFLDKWPNFVKQIKAGDYAGAAANMRGSKWAGQVKGRAERLAKMMQSGAWPPEVNVG